MNSGILCNYCRERQAYFLNKAHQLAACGRCTFDTAPAVFTHWKRLAETGAIEAQPVGRTA